MKWWPTECRYGNMIRVRLGSVYHYGIFAGESEVIQFGLPPLPEYQDRPKAVLATDMAQFSCGRIPEIAQPERKEKRLRLSPEETVARARARLGETGYDLISNNCEHFAYACAFGAQRSAQADAVLDRWRSRPLLDVYLAAIPPEAPEAALWPPARERQVAAMQDASTRRASRAAWTLLETAVRHSFGVSLRDLRLRRARTGKWTCRALEFSLSHTGGFAAAAVSDRPVGVDAENRAEFARRYDASARRAMAERARISPETDFLAAWTAKEALFKTLNKKRFQPEKLDLSAAPVRSITRPELDLTLSVCGERISSFQLYFVQDGQVRLLEADG